MTNVMLSHKPNVWVTKSSWAISMKRYFSPNNMKNIKVVVHCFVMHTSAKTYNSISYFMQTLKEMTLETGTYQELWNFWLREVTHLYKSISCLQSAILYGSPSWEDVFHINWSWATYRYISGSDAESQAFCT